MMKNLSLAAFVALAALMATPVCAEVPPSRPMDQMHGGCDAFAWNLAAEFHLWGGEAATAISGVNTAAITPVLVGKAVDVTLAPQSTVAFAAIPEQQRGGPETFAGLVSFVPPAAGVWRVSASTGLWIDAVSGGALVKSVGFEMQTGCATIFKSVAYHLPGGAPVVLQLSGSKPQAVRILVTPWVDGGHDAHAAHAAHEADDAVPADDAGQITHIMKARFDRPDAPLAVEPVAVGGEWADASWRQDGKGGRALLKKGGHGWSIHLCSGASLKDGMKLAEIGVPHEQAMSLATHLADAEGKLPAEAIAQFDSFEGTVMIEGGAHPSGGHDAHNQHSQQN